jgi:hypothetical protein
MCIIGISCSNNSDEADLDLIAVQTDDFWQFIDQKGKVVIDSLYAYEVTCFREGRALIRAEMGSGFIDKKGRQVVEPTLGNATPFFEGLAWTVNADGRAVAINVSGDSVLAVPKNATKVYPFSEGLAVVEIDGKCGYINKKGKIVIEPEYSLAAGFHQGRAFVFSDTWKVIDKKGKIIVDGQFDKLYADFTEQGYAIVIDNNGKYGTIDKDGKWLINPQFEGLMADGDLLGFVENKKYGWGDLNGKIIIPAQFTWIGAGFRTNDIVSVIIDGKVGFVDKKGNIQFDDECNFIKLVGYHNLIPVRKGDKWGYVDTKGKWLIDAQFEDAWGFVGDVAPVAANKKIGFINKEGKYVAQPVYKNALFGNGYFCEINYKGEIELYDRSSDYKHANFYVYSVYREPVEEPAPIEETPDNEEAAQDDGINIPKTKLGVSELEENPKKISEDEQKRLRLSDIKTERQDIDKMHPVEWKTLYQSDNGRLETVYYFYKDDDGYFESVMLLVSYDSNGNYVDCIQAACYSMGQDGDYDNHAVIEGSTVRIESIIYPLEAKPFTELVGKYKITPKLKFKKVK